MKLVAYTTYVSLCLLAFYAMGFSPIRLAFPFLILLSGITILSFVQLGQQAFHLFDPTRLSDSLFIDLDRCVRRATVAGSFWEDNSFPEAREPRGRICPQGAHDLGGLLISH